MWPQSGGEENVPQIENLFCWGFLSLSSEPSNGTNCINHFYFKFRIHRIRIGSSFLFSMEWYTQWLAKLFYCYYFLVHIYMIRLNVKRHLFGHFSVNPYLVHKKQIFEIHCLWLLIDLIKALTKWQFKFSDTSCSSQWGHHNDPWFTLILNMIYCTVRHALRVKWVCF